MSEERDAVPYDRVAAFLSEPRLKPFLNEADGDYEKALLYYEWNVRMSGEAMLYLSQLEVMIRNAMDRELASYFHESERGMPWFDVLFAGASETDQDGRDRQSANFQDAKRTLLKEEGDLRKEGNRNTLRMTRDQILARQTFGTWDAFLLPKYEDLWREALHKAFPNAHATRKDVRDELVKIRNFRNKVAHNDSLRKVNVPRQMNRIMKVAGWISEDGRKWLKSLSSWKDVYSECPVMPNDVLVVAAKTAWDIYRKKPFYVCQPGRYFREDAKWLAFYENSVIHNVVPRILDVRDNVEWSDENAAELLQSDDPEEKRLGKFIRWTLNEQQEFEFNGDVYKVLFLTSYEEPEGKRENLVLPHDVPHQSHGKGTGFTRRQRYVPSKALEVANNTEELVSNFMD